MSDRIVVALGAVLGVGALVAAALVLRPRPANVREVAYLVLPPAGAVVLAVLAWWRL